MQLDSFQLAQKKVTEAAEIAAKKTRTRNYSMLRYHPDVLDAIHETRDILSLDDIEELIIKLLPN